MVPDFIFQIQLAWLRPPAGHGSGCLQPGGGQKYRDHQDHL